MTEFTVTKFIDQWSAELTQELSAAGTVAWVDPAKAALLISGPNTGRGYTLTLDDGNGTIEIIHATFVNVGNGSMTVQRNRWDTTSQIWPVGSTIELRIPAAILNHHMLRCPVSVSEEDATTFHDLVWRLNTATHLMLTQNISVLGMESVFVVSSDMAGMFIHDLIIQQDATGGRTVGWDPEFHWPGGSAPTVSTGANAADIFRFFRVAPAMNAWAGVILGQNIAL